MASLPPDVPTGATTGATTDGPLQGGAQVPSPAPALASPSAGATPTPTSPTTESTPHVIPAPPGTPTGGVLVQIPAIAEDGATTTEYAKGQQLAILLTAVNGLLGLLVAFGIHISAAQWTAILSFEGSLTAVYGVYALSRGIRKSGTGS